MIDGTAAQTEAAYAFVDTMVPRSDEQARYGPLWHGWALREAFIAGAQWQAKAVPSEGNGD